MDSNSVAGRQTGFETELTKVSIAVASVSDKFDQLMTAVNNMSTPPKGQSKGKVKMLVQATDAAVATAASAAADAEFDDPTTQSHTKSARKAEA